MTSNVSAGESGRWFATTTLRPSGVTAAAIGSIEARLPVWRRPHSAFSFELAPFFDAGYSWDTDRPNIGPQTLVSVGIGGRFAYTNRASFQIYWGYPIKDVQTAGGVAGEYSLQDDGIHLAFTLEWP